MNRRTAQPQYPGNQGTIRHLSQEQLARRWNLSGRTLERWRWLKTGPPYLKLGRHVVYREDDVVAYETAQARR